MYYVVERYQDSESDEVRNKIVDEYPTEEIAEIVAWTCESSNTNDNVWYTIIEC